MSRPSPGDSPFVQLLRARRMVRAFAPDPLTGAEVEQLVWAARRAPSAGNAQGTELLVLDGPAETGRYWDATLPVERRATFRWPELLVAPLLIIPCARPSTYVERYGEDDKAATGLGQGPERWAVPYWHVDAGMAALAVLLAAQDLGLGALLFGLFSQEPVVKEAFAIPDDVQPVATIAIGHPRPDDPGRSAGRPRRSDDEVVHRGGW